MIPARYHLNIIPCIIKVLTLMEDRLPLPQFSAYFREANMLVDFTWSIQDVNLCNQRTWEDLRLWSFRMQCCVIWWIPAFQGNQLLPLPICRVKEFSKFLKMLAPIYSASLHPNILTLGYSLEVVNTAIPICKFYVFCQWKCIKKLT